MPPPKYSTCALQSTSTNVQPPSYDEAVKMIAQHRNIAAATSTSG